MRRRYPHFPSSSFLRPGIPLLRAGAARDYLTRSREAAKEIGATISVIAASREPKKSGARIKSAVTAGMRSVSRSLEPKSCVSGLDPKADIGFVADHGPGDLLCHAKTSYLKA